MSQPLPPSLADAVEALLADVSPPELARASAALTARYRDPRPRGGPVARTQTDLLAYLATRLPATFAAVSAALAAVAEQRPAWQPRTLLDLGAGPGTALWAASTRWPALERVVAVEAEPRMLSVGKRLAEAAPAHATGIRTSTWLQADLAMVSDGTLPEAGAPFDLVVLAYVLGELPPPRLAEVVRLAQAATASDGVTLIVEPGTPSGFARVRDARALLIQASSHVVAPCPYDAPCPVPDGDWCHVSVRLPRTAGHRAAKAGALGYEDEKFSYVAVSRTPVSPVPARIIRHPRLRPRLIELALCTPNGLQSRIVTKSDREGFRLARKAAWGDAWTGSEEA